MQRNPKVLYEFRRAQLKNGSIRPKYFTSLNVVKDKENYQKIQHAYKRFIEKTKKNKAS